MKLLEKKPKDERVVAENNQIYKVGYLILTLGIIVDLYLQFAAASAQQNSFSLTFRPVEAATFIVAQVVCLILQVRKGFMDDNRYAEADVFPKAHYALVGLITGAAASLLFVGVRSLTVQSWNAAQVIVLAVLGVSLWLCITAGTYLLQYICFRVARARRMKLSASIEQETGEE